MTQQSENQTEAQETETRILEAAQRVFVRRGLAGARTQEIADEAGVNRALINYYFRSKEKLADAVFIRIARTLFPSLIRTLASDLPLRDKLVKAIDLEIQELSRNPYMPLYILAELQYQPKRLRATIKKVVSLDMLREAVFEKLQRQLDEEASSGRLRSIRAEDLLVMLMSLLIFPFAASGMIENLLGLDAEAQEAMTERRRNELADFILRGLKP